MELCDLSALEISRMLRSRQTSALEVTEACLARIEAVDGRPGMLDSSPETEEDARKVHAFISLMPE